MSTQSTLRSLGFPVELAQQATLDLITPESGEAATILRESSGPTNLTVGTVADGQMLVRDGNTLVGDDVPSGFTGGTVANQTTFSQGVIIPSGEVLQVGGPGDTQLSVTRLTVSEIASGGLTAIDGDCSIGQSAGNEVGFYGAVGAVRAAAIPDATGGSTEDAEARAAINAVLTVLRNLNLIAT